MKVYKVLPIPAHKEFYDDGSGRIRESIPITAMALKHFGNDLVTGDQKGLIQYCDETFKYILVIKDAHSSAGMHAFSIDRSIHVALSERSGLLAAGLQTGILQVRAPSYCMIAFHCFRGSDDSKIHLWPVGRDRPEQTLSGHQNDVKCLHWHPHRALLATGSRDCSLRLWDPRAGRCVSNVLGHKKQVNCCQWNMNGNWLASGSMDGLVKIYDVRVMREMEAWKGHNSEVNHQEDSPYPPQSLCF